MTEFDLVLRGGTIVDGAGGPPRTGDVGVRDGRVVAVGSWRSGRRTGAHAASWDGHALRHTIAMPAPLAVMRSAKPSSPASR